ncbi:elongation factor 4 [Candidatus Roizmanbacteria bacterium]|nr:elongation factor 4 [Candidatus Roizmanbacteria bacterium]
MNNIRNFAIIAHIDHGKSTLADRLLELTGTVEVGHHREQMLDQNPISRERGITIKLAPVRMQYVGNDPRVVPINNNQVGHGGPTLQKYILNLIDTPGHVDFSYEVDRTLACVEGVVLLVDATQGIQAQTIANAYKAIEKNLVIIPVVNKIDMANAEVEKTKKQLIDFLGVSDEEIFCVSAKTGQGVEELLKTIIQKISGPNVGNDPRVVPNVNQSGEHGGSPLRALIFDSYYDSHRGVIAFVRVFDGELKKGKKVRLSAANETFEIQDVGYFKPELTSQEFISNGDIGYVVTNLKDIHKVSVGDSIVTNPSLSLPGYKKVKPMVFASIFPTDTSDYLNLQKALEKLYLNDSSLEFSSIHSTALGAGFRVGFLGLLHADVVRERLEREFDLSLVLTPPQVKFKHENNNFFEPYVKAMIVCPDSYVGVVMQLCQNYRGKFLNMDNKNQTVLEYELPMSELISDFFDNLKSVSSGYASLDWEFLRYQQVKADKLELLLNLEPIDEFSEVVVEERSYEKASFLTSRLKDLIPRQQYEVKIQAKYKGKIIASARLAPFRKDVLIKSGKLVGGGDFGRKRKLLDKQKEGKKKMKMIGKVEIPKEAFMKLFKR